jgi:UDP-N-acetylmuramoyl-L-alanyl-D-glutamate--2,6-diaminopimelate ligase
LQYPAVVRLEERVRLSHLLEGAGLAAPAGADPEITTVTSDSRRVVPGALFVCVPGQKVDGHDFAPAAAAAGAVAIAAERPVNAPGAVVVPVPSARRALALLAAALHRFPDRHLKLAGVTGTNGKTTCTYLFEAIATAAAQPCGVIGTVSYRYAGRSLPAPHTTPEATDIEPLLADIVAAGCTTAVMEVSSHALALHRADGLTFRSAAFTNLTRDHLDFHEDMEAYFAAKARLFRELLAPDGVATLNGDDAYGRRLYEELRAGSITAWRTSLGDESADLCFLRARTAITGIRGVLHTPLGDVEIRSPLVGEHNLHNLLTATGLALGVGLPLAAVHEGLTLSAGAPGRLERIDGGGITVFVDYAHTDDALRRAAGALREVAPQRLIVVFGCGGDRDRGKRPLMGRAAAELADLVVITSDNPRTEDPASIVDQIVPGAERAGRRRLREAEARAGETGFVVEVDRRAAIDLAVACARPGDVILVAGKGHEDYQILGTGKIHFDDREEARRALGVKP